jgi:hypothetical protein
MTDEQRAALKIQALARGKSGRVRYEHIRDEEACRQWVAYYVAVGEYADAEELGWDGENPPPPTAEELEANIQALRAEDLAAESPELGVAPAPALGPVPATPAAASSLPLKDAALHRKDSPEPEGPTVFSSRWFQQLGQSVSQGMQNVLAPAPVPAPVSSGSSIGLRVAALAFRAATP